jgi:hypothetical protein
VAPRLAAARASAGRVWARRPAAGRLAAGLFAAAIVLAGGMGVGFQAALPSLLPSPLDWRATTALLERDARRGDALVVSPAWAERVRMIVPRGLRVVASSASASEAAPLGAAGAELEGVRRVWLVSLTGVPGFSWAPELELLARSAAPEPPLRVGQLQITRFELSHPDLPLATLGEGLAGARVELGSTPCAADGPRFRCASDRTEAEIERAVVEVRGLPRSCLLVKVAGEAAPIRITFPAIRVGRSLRGNAGLAAPPGGEAVGSLPLTIAVRVAGEDAAAVQVDGAGWPTYRVDTGRWAGERHPISIELVAPGDRAVCLQAVTLP